MRGFSWRPIAMIMSVAVLCPLTLLAASPSAAAAADGQRLSIDVLSSRADQVSGGDALLRVRLDPGMRVSAQRDGRRTADDPSEFRAARTDPPASASRRRTQ